MRHFFDIFDTLKGVVTPAIMCFATPARGAIIWVIDWQAEFPKDGVAEIPVVQAMGGDTAAHGDQWI